MNDGSMLLIARKQAGVTLGALSEKTGIRTQTLIDIEKNRISASWDQMQQLLKAVEEVGANNDK
jgi:cytoskeletal protein RodZ